MNPDSQLASIISNPQKLREHCSEVRSFLAGVKNFWPSYGEISEKRDYQGEIEVFDPKTRQNYRFLFRVWQTEANKAIITSEGKEYVSYWSLPTLLVKPLIKPLIKPSNRKNKDYVAAAERFKTSNSFALKCALIEAIVNHLTKEDQNKKAEE